MYGDYAPIAPIVELLNSYEKLHLYADDAHGMSWYGENGKGYILSNIEDLKKVVVATSFAKAFGVGGGVFVFPNEALYQKVKNCGGPFIFSGPHQVPVLGAAIASAKIHLTEEINDLQKQLSERTRYCHSLLKAYKLPVISSPETPIFFVGLGLLRVGINMVKRMMNSGFYVNLSVFPAVPETCTGVRFTITLHQSFEDIEKLVKALAFHFTEALAEEERSVWDIHRAFRKVASFDQVIINKPIHKTEKMYALSHYTSINQISQPFWDSLMTGKGTFDWKSLLVLEEAFSNNSEPEYNWNFHYYIIKDQKNKPVLATFFTITVAKDDMLAPASVSKTVEQMREKEPYFLTSKNMMMGSLISEGNHLYLDRDCDDWKKVLMMMVDAAWKQQDRSNAAVIIMRDFDQKDVELCEFFRQQGFLQAELPNANLLRENHFENSQLYLNSLKHSNRYYLKKRVFEFQEYFDVKISNVITDEEVGNLYQLYLNIANKSFEVNAFVHPKKLFTMMAESGHFEFISIYLKPEYQTSETRGPVGMVINHQTGNLYCFMLSGLDYSVSEKYNVYPQLLWQVVNRSMALNCPNVTLGYTASQNKRKFGAKNEERVAFIQMKDNFNMNLIEIMGKTTISMKL